MPNDDGFFVPLIMSFRPSADDLVSFHAYAAIMRLLLAWKQTIFPISPALLMYLVEGFEATTDLEFLKLVTPQIADHLATWPPPLEMSASGELQPTFIIGQDPMNLVFQVLPNLQVCSKILSECDTYILSTSLTPSGSFRLLLYQNSPHNFALVWSSVVRSQGLIQCMGSYKHYGKALIQCLTFKTIPLAGICQ
jgi:hypothetical protein